MPVNTVGFRSGYLGVIGPPFSDAGWLLTNLYWHQRMSDGRLAIAAGWVDTTDYVDASGLISPWLHFLNLVFTNGSGTIPFPAQGVGLAADLMIGDNVYATAGLADANGSPGEPGDSLESFFSDNEYFSHVELGWTTSSEDRHVNNAHVTLWHADSRKMAGVIDGWGGTFSIAHLFDGTWMPFVRGGYAEDGGALLERSLSGGIGYLLQRRGDLIGLGVNFGQPSETTFTPGLPDQLTVELFYRMQLTKNLAITPDFQLVSDPAMNPAESILYYFGLRARLAL